MVTPACWACGSSVSVTVSVTARALVSLPGGLIWRRLLNMEQGNGHGDVGAHAICARYAPRAQHGEGPEIPGGCATRAGLAW